jgi:hypothetical protein
MTEMFEINVVHPNWYIFHVMHHSDAVSHLSEHDEVIFENNLT